MGRLSADSQRQAMGIVGSLFTYLVNTGYLARNPWTPRRRKRTPRVRQVELYLDQAQRTAVLDFIETLPQESRRERQHYEPYPMDRALLLRYGIARVGGRLGTQL